MLIQFKNFVLCLLNLLFLSILVGCNNDGNDVDVEPTKKDDGKNYTCENSLHSGYTTIEHNGTTREYILHVSSSYNQNNPASLIIAFHGFGGCASYFADEEVGDLNSVADNENVIIAYPQAVEGPKGDVYWEPGDSGVEKIDENDIYFTEKLIEDIKNNYTIDSSHVYAIGYSNGGMMSYGLACSRGDLVAAVGIMSGIMLPQSCSNNDYTSVIHFHGIGDDVLPYEGNQDYQSVSDVVDFWLSHNGIPSSNLVSSELDGGDVTKDAYSGGNGNTSVELYTIHQENGKSGGHVWFSNQIDGKSPSQIMWDFLKQYSLED